MAPAATVDIEIVGERLRMHPERALEWPERRTLIIADPHFGKDDHFRRAGIPLPRGVVIDDLQRLGTLVSDTGAERVIVLGDFVHAITRSGDAFLHAFAVWRRGHASLAVEVVVGNHDRREDKGKWKDLVAWRDDPALESPFVLTHDAASDPRGYALGGHVHPAVTLPGLGTKSVPVFWFRPRYAVLPSFGSFTGGARIRVDTGDRLFAAAPERVVALPAG